MITKYEESLVKAHYSSIRSGLATVLCSVLKVWREDGAGERVYRRRCHQCHFRHTNGIHVSLIFIASLQGSGL